MDRGLDCRGEPLAKPPYSLRWWEEQVVDHYGGKGNIWTVRQSSSVNEFSFGNSNWDPQISTLPLDEVEKVLKRVDVRTYRVQADRNGEIVDI